MPYIANGDDGPIDVDMELSRDRLESLTLDLIARTISTCERIIGEAGCTVDDIDEMLLVGGQSRMPLVQKMVTDFMGKPPSKGVNPDEAVAIGAAMMAHSLAGQTDDAQRPRLQLARVHAAQHAPFVGLNRAQAAVLEGGVLVSRVHMLAPDKVDGRAEDALKAQLVIEAAIKSWDTGKVVSL